MAKASQVSYKHPEANTYQQSDSWHAQEHGNMGAEFATRAQSTIREIPTLHREVMYK